MAEVAAQLPWRRARAGAGRGDHGIATIGIICRLRRPRDGACRHCALGRAADGTQMSHYIFGRRWPLTTAALAVLALSGRVMPRTAAAPLITGGRFALLLPSAQVLTAARAVRLSSVAWPTDPNGDPAAPAVKLPKLRLHLHTPAALDSAGGRQAIKGLRQAPTGAPQRRGPGVRVVSEPGPSLYVPSRITKETTVTRCGDGQQQHQGKYQRAAAKPARRQRGRQEGGRLRPAQPALSEDDQDIIEAAALPAPPPPQRQLRPNPALGYFSAPTRLRRPGGLLLPSRDGLILDSAPVERLNYRLRRASQPAAAHAR